MGMDLNKITMDNFMKVTAFGSEPDETRKPHIRSFSEGYTKTNFCLIILLVWPWNTLHSRIWNSVFIFFKSEWSHISSVTISEWHFKLMIAAILLFLMWHFGSRRTTAADLDWKLQIKKQTHLNKYIPLHSIVFGPFVFSRHESHAHKHLVCWHCWVCWSKHKTRRLQPSV